MGIFKRKKKAIQKEVVNFHDESRVDLDATDYESQVDAQYENPSKKINKKRKKKSLITFKRLVVVAVLIAALYFIMHLKYFGISEIIVSGNEAIEAEKVIEESGLKTGDNIFFINKSKIKDKMMENSLYREIDISRKLPSTLEISIVERKGKLVLPYGEKFTLLDEEGVVIGLVKEKPQVTELENLNIKNMDKGEEISIKEDEEFKKALRLFKESEKSDIFFQYISVGEECRLTIYGNLFVKGDYDNIMDTLENGKLKVIIADLYEKGISRGTIKIEGPEDISFTPVFE